MRKLAFLLLPLLSFAAEVDFSRDIQPIFKKSCYGCHGEKKQLGQLRLDAKSAALKGGFSGSVITPGDAASSELHLRVAGLGDGARMPMGSKLSDAEIDLIKRWINEGAKWPDDSNVPLVTRKHWAFEPPLMPAIPASGATWARNPIDRFVHARLDKEGLAPSPEADKITLLRRLSLDLIGLPPTIQEVNAFLADKTPTAYEKQVQRLLASPHYGERWARLWLDAARYADSDGFEKDKQRSVWFYRDYVINAFNRDLPYKQFITEQLAGDLLPNPTQDQIVATGFLRNSMINEEGGIDPEQFRMEAMFDRMDAIGKSILGLTVGCAQCHTHKYDPISHDDYYRMFAVLNNSYEGSATVYTSAETKLRYTLLARINALETSLKQRTPDWKQRIAAWEAALPKQPTWTPLKLVVEDISNGGQRYLDMPDGSWLPGGYAPTKHKVHFESKLTSDTTLHALRLELLPDPNMPHGGTGRSIYGTSALSEIELTLEEPGQKPRPIKFVRAFATINTPDRPLDSQFDDKGSVCRVTGPIEYAIDGKRDTAWLIDAGPGRRQAAQQAVFLTQAPVRLPAGSTLHLYADQAHGGWNSDDNQNLNLGRMRFTVSDQVPAGVLPQSISDILAIARDQRTDAQWNQLFSYWRTTVPEFAATNQQLETLWSQHPEGTSQLVLQERPEPRTTHVLERGDFLKPKKQVQPGVLSFLNKPATQGPMTRLSLAQWMTDEKAPTTARAIVNRIWQAYFGTGIVATSEDLGMQSETPSHPELLDYLAVRFMQEGWSLKKLHTWIVTSSTYRQQSALSETLLAKDPYNRLLARGPRFRVDGEIVRDISLSAAGLLNAKVGGPSVYPPAPGFLFQPPTSYGPKPWHEMNNNDRYRRALYTFRYRSVPYPMLQTFDTPNGDTACVRRSRSNTPLQALVALNEPLFLDAARNLAALTLARPLTAEKRLDYAFRRVLSRSPNPEERTQLTAFLNKQLQRYRNGADPWALLVQEGDKPALPPNTTAAEWAAWTLTSRILLNLDEAITKE